MPLQVGTQFFNARSFIIENYSNENDLGVLETSYIMRKGVFQDLWKQNYCPPRTFGKDFLVLVKTNIAKILFSRDQAKKLWNELISDQFYIEKIFKEVNLIVDERIETNTK